MNLTATTFGARLAFFYEKRSKAYPVYGDASIAEEKVNKARKNLQSKQLRCLAGRVGV